MKNFCTILILLLLSIKSFSQSCDEQIEYLKENYNGSTYTSYTSTAIAEITFYDVRANYSTNYYAVVCFKGNGYGCSEYLYRVGSSTESYYSMNYLTSAGKAFWKYIEPYGDNSPCAPDMD